MATKDTSTGLLSKMARFVRNPTKDWAELDRIEPEQDSGYSKQALKEMIERKRQNDFVRRREFDYLRKLRRNGPTISPDLAGRPSFFQSSIASNLNERATTLKKIDEIEAQMSKQWWRGKQDEATTQESNFPVESNPPSATDDSVPMADAPTLASELSLDTDSGQMAEYESTQRGLSIPGELAFSSASRQAAPSRNMGSRNFETDASEFSTSKLFSIDLGAGLADPELEEAAIRFANGDDAGAETGLLDALRADNVSPDSADGWAAALFDFYRATGQQASFDSVAIDYAQRFGRSAPAWFSTPDLLGRKVADAAGPGAASSQSGQITWECPAELGLSAMQALLTRVSRETTSLRLNWRRLVAITPDAAKALAGLFAECCSKPYKLYFGGAEVLEGLLKSLTPSGDKAVDAFWWQLRLDTLRILRLQDDFELAALDFCVTYEVSPPPWQDARCDYVPERVNATPSLESAHSLLTATSTGYLSDFNQPVTAIMGFDGSTAAEVELSGEVLGDAAEALDKLQAGLRESHRLVISCARLIRVDFSAAGSILNWVAVRESEGCQVQFRDVPRLVAAFFNVIGINEHAQVVLRTS